LGQSVHQHPRLFPGLSPGPYTFGIRYGIIVTAINFFLAKGPVPSPGNSVVRAAHCKEGLDK
jgi:hypothetical protein